MIRLLGALAVTLLFLAATATPVSAQMLCTDRMGMLNRLADQYQEELVQVKEWEELGLLEILASPSQGTWTLLLTKPGGISCVLATGKGLDRKRLRMAKNVERAT